MTLTAKTRNNIFDDMQSYLQSLDPRLTDFNTGSVLNSLIDTPAAEMEQLWNALIVAFNAAYVTTATGEDLDNKVADFGLTRKEATFATGFVTFSRSTTFAQDFTIPSGTVIQTPSTTTVAGTQFETTEEAILPANQQYVSSVPIRASLAGSSGNVGVNAITVISNPPAGIESVTNPALTAGGTDEESDEDLRARVPIYLSSLARGTKASLEAAALSVTGVSSVSILEYFFNNVFTPGVVDVYIADSSGTATDALIAAVQTEIEDYRPVSVTVFVKAPVALYFDIKAWIVVENGYSVSAVKANVATAITDYLSKLKLGQDMYRSELISVITLVDGVTSVNTLIGTLYSAEAKNCSLVATLYTPTDPSTDYDLVTSASFNTVDVTQTPYDVNTVFLGYNLDGTSEDGTDYYLTGSFSKRRLSMGTNLPVVNYQLTIANGGIQDLSTLVVPYEMAVTPPNLFPVIAAPPGQFTSDGIWLQADTFNIGTVYFTGTGLNDLTPSGVYTGVGPYKHYRVKISYTGGVGNDRFDWSKDGGRTWEETATQITGAAQDLEEGIQITFAAGLGHTLNERWDFALVHDIAATNYGNGATVTSDNKTITLAAPLPPGTTEVFVQFTESGTTGANTQTEVVCDYQLQQVTTTNTPIGTVEGVWLQTDPNYLDTNYYIDGSYVASTGVITLGTKTPNLPNEPVFIKYWKDILNNGLQPYVDMPVPNDRIARAGTLTINED